MALQRRSYGFNGYDIPHMPRAARSSRRSRVLKRKDNDKGTCAFDVLATVARELLSETKNSPPSSDSSLNDNRTVTAEEDSKEEKDGKDKFIEERSFHQRNFNYKDLKSYKLNRVQNDDCNRRFGISTPSLDVGSSGVQHYSSYNRSECEGSKKIVRTDGVRNRELYTSHNRDSSSYLGVREPLEGKPSPSVGSFGSVKFPVCKNQTTRDPVPNSQDDIKLHTRDDDDENDYDFFEPRYENDSFNKPPLRVGDRRLKKILVANHCNDFADEKDNKQHSPGKQSYSYKNCKRTMKHERSIKDYPIKKRKLYELSCNKEDVRNEGTDNVTKTKVGDWHLKAASSSQIHATTDHVSFQPRNHQVELRIKSFTVPDLRIEIPETASVGSLKRAVMEAVNSELGGGVRVGVLLQGTEIGDDSKSLLQSGISYNNAKDSLEFRLEPNNAPTPVNTCGPEGSTRQRFHNSKQPLARYSQTSVVTQKGFHHSHVEGNKRSFDSCTDRDDRPHPAASCSDMVVSDKASTESKAIVPLQTTRQYDADALPLRKSKRSEFAQRRIRRPFTVAEVEALVQAVEELGTGRWRDVKLRAFDHAKHRTYVDLKDKWKTLVHTARISPQQRRGEPVPQELLDRVLVAHAYWSQQQAKQLKSEPDTSLLL